MSDDGMGSFLDLPDISSDLDRLEKPTSRPSPQPTFSAETAPPSPSPIVDRVETLPPSAEIVNSTPAPAEVASTPSPGGSNGASSAADGSVPPVAADAPVPPTTAPSPTSAQQAATPAAAAPPQSAGSNATDARGPYYSCPPPPPEAIPSRDSDGNPVRVTLEPPLADCAVAYDFELAVAGPPEPTDGSAGEEYVQALLPGILDRLGHAVADYLLQRTEGTDGECAGYEIDGWRRRASTRRRLGEEDRRSTRILGLTGGGQRIDPIRVCDPPSRGCYVINGRLNATYSGNDEAGVKSVVSRRIKDEMSRRGEGRAEEYGYQMRYLGPGEDETPAQSAATPSAIISAEDILEHVPDRVGGLTPVGIAIVAALAAAFVMACYSLFARDDGEFAEEVLDEVREAKRKVKKKGPNKKRGKDAPLAVEEDGDSSCGYDLESVAIDARGCDDSTEAIEVGPAAIPATASFGYEAATRAAEKRGGGPKKFSLAEAVNTIPRPDHRRAGRDIRKMDSPSRAAASLSAKLASQIDAEVRMISGCRDSQTSADADITAFQLPDPQGRSGGACTAALLEALYGGRKAADPKSWVEVLTEMRGNLLARGYDQVPQLTSSNLIDVKEPMVVVPDPSGTKRAVLIGINYRGQDGELSGCHSDIKHISQYLCKVHGFQKRNMTVLLDNGKCQEPSYANIIKALENVARESQPGDAVWLHYSGHGGRLPDDSNEEEDGYDETIIPLDFKKRGQIRDDDLLKYFVKPMKKGVTVTCIMDCCHSGTVLDLPYQYVANGEQCTMESNRKFYPKKRNAPLQGSSAVCHSILQDLESYNNSSNSAANSMSRGSPRRADSCAIQTLPSVRETDLAPPMHDTPSHRSKWSRLISPTSVNELGEEQWEV